MIKKILYILVLIPTLIQAQLPNDWIDYEQNYFKFPIAQDGIYRIDFQELVNAGLNIGTLDPRNFQIFAKGEEVPIYIQGESDGSFDSNDFIEFFGERNTGWYDHNLFSDSAHILNPYMSLASDTLYYFLTWNSSVNNKRMDDEFDLNFNAYTPIDYFWSEYKHLYNQFNGGVKTSFGWSVPEYSEGEGYYLSSIAGQKEVNYKFNAPNKYAGGPDGWMKTKFFGLGAYTHYIQVRLNDSLIYDDNFFDQKSIYVEDSIPVDWVEEQSIMQYKSVTPVLNTNDKVGIGYFHLRYAHSLDMEGKTDFELFLPSGNESKDLLVMENYNNLNSTVRLYDLTNGKRIQVQPLSGKYYALVSNNGVERRCYLTNESSIRTISGISSVSKGSSKFIDYQSLITAKGGVDFLLVTGSSLMDAAEEYGDYRESNGLRTIVANMDQLYDQFSYGIRKHPISIRNYADAIMNHWGYDPTYLFLCGKSISMNYFTARFGSDFERNIVPTWSVLGADVGFTSRLKPGSILEPDIATGRISANNETELRAYLKKVQDYESATPSDWMKQILHFGGGSSAGEQQSFKGFLEDYEELAEDSLFGGNVHTFLKNSSDPLQINLSDSVSSLINNGVTLMTFFGHAYGNNFDQSIDEPENYENTGRYSFILANSCLIGNIHTQSVTSGSERFVLAADKGAIGFLGSSSLGVPAYLYRYSKEFYDNLSKDYYGWPVGKVVQQTIKDMQDSISTLNRDVAMHMTLHCDPAIVLNSHEKPDYTLYGNAALTQPNVYFSPDDINSELDSFDINIIVKNIGKAYGDTFDLLITRDFPSQGFPDTTYSIELSGIFYSDTITLTLPIDKINGLGLNKFSIRADALSEIDELNELNNNVEIELFINSSDIVPIYPYEYAIVPTAQTILKASTGNPYSEESKYYFQIDTNDAFASPIRAEEILVSDGGVINWDPSNSAVLSGFYSNFPSNTTISAPQVFYWRVSVDSTGNNGFAWKESSFQHVSGKTGWGQSHFHQFKKDDFVFLDYKKPEREVSFIKQSKTLTAKTHKKAGYSYRIETKYEIDGAIQCFESSYWATMFFVAVIDRNTLLPWHSQGHGDYGHINYSSDYNFAGWSEYNFYFLNNNSTAIDSLMAFVEDVPDSNYVLFYSFRGNNCAKWLSGQPNSNEYEAMYSDIGASVDSLKNYPNDYPYILFFKKGDTNSVVESFSPDGLDFISIKAEMKNNWFNGKTESTLIGPSTNWGSFHWNIDPSEIGNNKDSSRISIYGIDANGNKSLFIDSLTGTGDLIGLNDSIDAADYPYLELEAFFADDSVRTPDVLTRWQVTYDEVPEAAINPLKVVGYTLVDSVQQGEELYFITAIENISTVAMDSIQVSYKIIDNNYTHFPFSYTLEQPLAPGEVVFDTVIIPTITLIGENNLWYEINPFVGPKPWQLEQYHFNNLYLHEFSVFGDNINPLLDVTFDGVHILNGDIVNPKPNIIITLDDENQYLKLDDEGLVQVFINYPNGSHEDSLVLLDPSEYVFTPADFPKNKCTIEFEGDFKVDGVYELRIMATDKSSNISGSGDGTFDYRIEFEVITESSITQLINYPNPFSTSTRFVFTLTGTEVPDNMLIQIMTITGKVVKEITQQELGPIHIGRNITEYEWDGTDQYGDKLANGVYLYKVQVQQDGGVLKERDVTISTSEGTTTLSNKFFKKGLGKMYILR